MKEYWVNVYEDEYIGAKCDTRNECNYLQLPNIAKIYRLHVKMKEEKGYHHSYLFGWDKNLNCATNRC